MVLAGRRRHKQWGQGGRNQEVQGIMGTVARHLISLGKGFREASQRKGCPQRRIKEMCQLKKKEESVPGRGTA